MASTRFVDSMSFVMGRCAPTKTMLVSMSNSTLTTPLGAFILLRGNVTASHPTQLQDIHVKNLALFLTSCDDDYSRVLIRGIVLEDFLRGSAYLYDVIVQFKVFNSYYRVVSSILPLHFSIHWNLIVCQALSKRT